ncbi:MAG: fatty acid cis/trans isomerase [Myxococcales bacterium]|nr:fatty acid cis/trans isomerase [Myxococcales bacterium]
MKRVNGRANNEFWASFDRFQAHFNATEPLQAGLYDLNRYSSVARDSD